MSAFSIPRNVPNFQSSQRQMEDSYWRPSGTSTSNRASSLSISPFGAFRSDRELPMYKDKPYGPGSRRRGMLGRKKLWAGIALIIVVFWVYVLPLFGSSKEVIGGTGKLAALKNVKGEKGNEARRKAVVQAMEKSWAGYEKYAWGFDEYHPDSKSGRYMVPPTGLGWIIVDALDTLMLMNLTTQLKHAREWISTTLTYDLDHDVNTFETTIRMLGGFLSAHYLQTKFPDMAPVTFKRGNDEDLYLEKATDLAERILGAFETPSGVPWSSFNLKEMKGIQSHADGGAASLAEATTVQLEFKYLANLTGEKNYWDKVEKVMEVVDAGGEPDGLKGIYIHPNTGQFTSQNVRLGSRGDSYYEYLIKQYYQTSQKEPVYLEMWKDSLAGIKKHLITYSQPSNFTVLAERPWGVSGNIEPKMDHLVCFMPGTIALSTTGGLPVPHLKRRKEWTAEKEEDLNLAIELMKTCWGMYAVTKTGLAPEITYFNVDSSHGIPPRYDPSHKTNPTFDPNPDAEWRKDYIIHNADRHNLQRPETVESLFYMWRITKDPIYREWGWTMFEAFMTHTEALDGAGYTSISNVNEIPAHSRNNMESFWPAETLKYFYLLFSPDELLPLDSVVFNTEAHPFPRFEMGKLFSTGWKRKARDGSGMVLKEVATEKVLEKEPEKTPEKKVEKKAEIAAEVGIGGGDAKNVVEEVGQMPLSPPS